MPCLSAVLASNRWTWVSLMPVSPELRAALQRLREVRSERPRGERETESFAAWRERIADALDSLAGVLIYQEDRQRAAAEAVAARAEAERIRAELNQLG
jgi:Lon protease-like protein